MVENKKDLKVIQRLMQHPTYIYNIYVYEQFNKLEQLVCDNV